MAIKEHILATLSNRGLTILLNFDTRKGKWVLGAYNAKELADFYYTNTISFPNFLFKCEYTQISMCFRMLADWVEIEGAK